MKIILIYISPNKTTQMITKELFNILSKDNHQVIELNIGKGANRDYKNIDPNIFKDTDLIGIGSPVYHMRALEPLTDFLGYMLPKITLLNQEVKCILLKNVVTSVR